MLERDIEKALIRHIEKLGGTCEKFSSGVRNVPDRIITLALLNVSDQALNRALVNYATTNGEEN